jgi:flotillin
MLELIEKMLTTLVLLGLAASLIGGSIWWYLKSFVSSAPNEWMLVIRNGQLIHYGVGISFNKRWGDKIVKFPSKIHRVNFSAQQVTQEKQGIEISGVIIWEVFRLKDGPLKAYRNLGEDIAKQEPTCANDVLREMSSSIVRHRIANSTIESILKNRDYIRTEIKNELNKTVNGWGVWLESVEITDVKILSGSLFKHLQTEYREEQTLLSSTIKINTQNELKVKEMKQNQEQREKEIANDFIKKIYESKESLKVQTENQKVILKSNEIEKQKTISNGNLTKHTEKNNDEFVNYKLDLEFQKNLADVEKQKEMEIRQREIDAIKFENELNSVKNELELEALKKSKLREIKEKKAQLENEIKKGIDFKKRALLTSSEIFKRLRISSMNVVKLNDQETDPILSHVNSLIGSIVKIKESVQ